MNLKLTAFCLSLICSTSMFGQNWSPFPTTATCNYRISPTPVDSSEVYATPDLGLIDLVAPFVSLWVDSVAQDGLDSVFYFNPYNYQKGYNITWGLAHFLERKMVKRNGGIYDFYSPDTFSIHTLANLNDSWVYRPSQSDTARVIDVVEEIVLGQIDSVKLILLSSGDTIRLSQNYGILSFPDTSNIRYNLVGIEYDSINYVGLSMPNTYDVYDYNVGDKFYYISHWTGTGISNVSYRMDSIMNKQVTSSGYSYDVYMVLVSNTGSNSTLTTSISTSNYNYEPTSIADKKNGARYSILLSDYVVRVFEDAQGRLYKNSGNYTSSNSGFVTTNCGSTMVWISWVGGGSNSRLIGSVKNGVVVGDTVVWAHYTPMLSIDNMKNADLSIQLAPNPIHQTLYLSLEGTYQTENIHLRIMSLEGRVLRDITQAWDSKIAMDVNDIPSGIYILEVNAGAIREVQKIVIQK